jgi:hypothetical protein
MSGRVLPILFALIGLAASGVAARAGGMPEIRSSPANPVPSCVTPERLMAFVATRNPKLAPKFMAIADAYRDLGGSAHVRWDYAFFQMLLETNFLMYKRGDGSSGDVGLAQNNFAGIGATGGGVPGDRYGDVRTGVLAHMQHLVAYSGERVERPVAQRTREYQGDIIEISRKLGRPVTFSDLSRRWAVDRAYGRNIETIAELYRKGACTGQPTRVTMNDAGLRGAIAPPSKLGAGSLGAGGATAEPVRAERSPLVRTVWQRGEPVLETVPPVPQQAAPRRTAPPAVAMGADALPAAAASVPVPAPVPVPRAGTESGAAPVAMPPAGIARFAMSAQQGLGQSGIGQTGQTGPTNCRIYSASYGGAAAVLIRHQVGGEMRLTTVVLEEDQRAAMTESFLAAHAPQGEVVGQYASRMAAVSAARELCPAGHRQASATD